MSDRKKRVLIVDDDPIQIKLMEGVLSKKGYEILSTDQADKGLQLAMDEDIDIIFLDVMMPVINGYNFCQLLKKEDSKKDIIIIFVTARNEFEDIQLGLESGADAYLSKPINTEELLKTLSIVLSGGN